MTGAPAHRLALAGVALVAASLVAPAGSSARGPGEARGARVDAVSAPRPLGERAPFGDEGPSAPTEVEPPDSDDSSHPDGPSSGPAALAHRARQLAAVGPCRVAMNAWAAPVPRSGAPRAARGPPSA